ncbi:MAG: transglycosylase domain-containing protein, partial [Oscillospiraceae bacterium]
LKLFGSKRGASTITQQLVKNLTEDKAGSGLSGALRKVREIFRAFMLEKKYTKPVILEAYLNTLRLSNNWAGVQAGARNYFGKDVSELSVAEAASLAGITKNPSVYNPYKYPDANLERRNDILYFMRKQGRIEEDVYQAALKEELVLNKEENTSAKTINSYFTDMVINQVIDDLMAQYEMTEGEATSYIYNNGLKIYSTVVPELQAAMEAEMRNSKEKKVFPLIKGKYKNDDGTVEEVYPQAAMVSVDYNGGVAAVVGGLGDKTGDRTLNRAVDSVRQTGSTMKPIGAYALAVDYGYINYSTPLFDDFVMMKPDPDNPGQEKPWPRNYDNNYSLKSVPVVQAIAKSLNTIAVRALQYVTPEVSYDFVKNTLHITSLVSPQDVDYGPMALGSMTHGVSPLEMAAAYAIFGNGGKYVTPHCYTTVEDASGEVLLETKVTSVQAISPETAYIINRALKQVLVSGTGAGLAPSRLDAVGKTGTTSDDKDHWFIGLTPYYSTATWWGYDQPLSLGWKAYSIHPPTSAWRNVMNVAQKELPKKSFPTSDKVITMDYCTESGDLAGDGCPGRATGYYTEGNIPGVCVQHS